MLADERTLEALEFASVRDRVVAATRTQRGRALAEALLPREDFSNVRRDQAHTAAARELVSGSDLCVQSAIDTEPLTQGAAQGRSLSPRELRLVGEAIAASAGAQRAVREDSVLSELFAGYTPLDDLRRALSEAIDEHDAVLDRASPALGRIRRSLAQAQGDARDRVGAMLKSAKYAKAIQDSVVTIREGRFVIPIKAEFAGEFPGIVHDTSASGQTLFVEPLAALETNNRLRTLRIEEEREVERILAELSRRIGERADFIEADVEMLAALDIIVAKAHVSRVMDATVPELDDEAVVRIENGRHPLLLERAVPQSIRLDAATRLLVISGPNMGGKSVSLKMLGLLVVMVYAGLQVPAALGTCVGRFARIVADIGDEQSIAANTSTFSSHLDRMRDVLSAADERTLVLVDEIGSGTEPSSGAALAIAMLERLLSSGARAVVTTHATELKLFAHDADAAMNASVRFDPQTFAPTYHLDLGAPGQSLAFSLARARGIDAVVVERAQGLLDSQERDYERALEELALKNAELQAEREGLMRERRTAARELEELARRQAELDAQRERFSQHAEERMQQALRDFTSDLQRRASIRASEGHALRPRVSPAQSERLTETLEAMRRDLGIEASASAEAGESGALASNDRVRVRSYGGEGIVIEDYGESVLVAFGSMKTVVSKREVERILRQDRQARDKSRPRTPSAQIPRLDAALRTSGELDVRGKRYADAEPLVDRWIDEALLAGSTSLRLIHGKGTGLLGRGLQEFLRGHPAVASVRYGGEEEGSHGVTMIELG
ncbi:MAG TPA: Smr/MutS family protein [Candidatus Tyrphobacter sp.]